MQLFYRDWDGNVKPTGTDSVITELEAKEFKKICEVCRAPVDDATKRCLGCGMETGTELNLPEEHLYIELEDR